MTTWCIELYGEFEKKKLQSKITCCILESSQESLWLIENIVLMGQESIDMWFVLQMLSKVSQGQIYTTSSIAGDAMTETYRAL